MKMKDNYRKDTSIAEEKWPTDGLEEVESCPICKETNRTKLHDDLSDQIFFCAPGKWTLYRCSSCGAGYIDPRPTPQTIGLAYKTYFTHSKNNGSSERSLAKRIRHTLANGYRNQHYGTKDFPSSRLGVLIAWLFPDQRKSVYASMRHLPRPTEGSRLLDIGCGSGEFLARARSAGWEVVGVDPDPKAVEVARSRGLEVYHGSINELNSLRGSFNGITLSHVIEHVHNPVDMLQACYRLLVPGGWIWIDTPNIDSQGYRIYGPHWRDLDPPRHLVVFSQKSLRLALEKSGFTNIKNMPWTPVCKNVFASSEAIKKEQNPIVRSRLTLRNLWFIRKAERVAKKEVKVREFITINAYKSSD